MGEVVRLVITQLVVDNVLFGGQMPDTLQLPDGFPSKYISEILACVVSTCRHFTPTHFRDEDGMNFKNCRRIMDELEVPVHGSADYFILKEICHTVSLRSAALVAAGGQIKN
jgi:hypothetical protein